MSFSQKILDPLRGRLAGFFSPKTFGAKEVLQVSFVLAILSFTALALNLFLLGLAGGYLSSIGLMQLAVFATAVLFILTLASQGLILFGFPLYYAQDQRSHMTGFRIILSTFMWMLLLLVFAVGVEYKLMQMSLNTMPVQDLQNVIQSLPE